MTDRASRRAVGAHYEEEAADTWNSRDTRF